MMVPLASFFLSLTSLQLTSGHLVRELGEDYDSDMYMYIHVHVLTGMSDVTASRYG